MSMPTVLILGGTSTIAKSVANAFARNGYPLYLAGRNEVELERIASDLSIRYKVRVEYGHFDAEEVENHSRFLQHVVREMDGISGVVLSFGDLGEHDKAIHDFAYAKPIIDRNFTGACSILTYCADYLAQKETGFIISISSVAGDRGRQSNYIYGAAKGGLSLFLQGLRNRLYPKGVRVLTIEPGFVDTPMTYGKEGMFLVASPEYVGEKIYKSVNGYHDVVYIPWFWRYIMWIVKMIPEPIFKRMKL